MEGAEGRDPIGGASDPFVSARPSSGGRAEMTNELGARVATPADATALCALINSAYRGEHSKAGWTSEADLVGGQRVDVDGVQEIIATPDSVILLSEQDHGTVACVHLQRTADDCYLGL